MLRRFKPKLLFEQCPRSCSLQVSETSDFAFQDHLTSDNQDRTTRSSGSRFDRNIAPGFRSESYKAVWRCLPRTPIAAILFDRF